MPSLFDQTDERRAEFSADEAYRYTLHRQWADGPRVAFIMFNPSTATDFVLDPTIRKCIGFAKRWGYGSLVVLNLYAIRSTDPTRVKKEGDKAIGPMNDYWIGEMIKECDEFIFAWGCAQHAPNIDKRISVISDLLESNFSRPKCLGYRQDGHPRHPLMLKYDTPRELFVWRQ